MALRALTLEVVGWSFVQVTDCTVRRPNHLVVESTRCPTQKYHGTVSTDPQSGWLVFRPGGRLPQSVAPTAW